MIINKFINTNSTSKNILINWTFYPSASFPFNFWHFYITFVNPCCPTAGWNEAFTICMFVISFFRLWLKLIKFFIYAKSILLIQIFHLKRLENICESITQFYKFTFKLSFEYNFNLFWNRRQWFNLAYFYFRFAFRKYCFGNSLVIFIKLADQFIISSVDFVQISFEMKLHKFYLVF